MQQMQQMQKEHKTKIKQSKRNQNEASKKETEKPRAGAILIFIDRTFHDLGICLFDPHFAILDAQCSILFFRCKKK
jgi:hypothetical protein